MGPNEAAVDTRPVRDATVAVGGKRAYTNRKGVAVIAGRRNSKVKATAGDTLARAKTRLGSG